MPTYTFDPVAKNLLIEFSDAELALAIRAISTFGNTALKDLFDSWLADITKRFKQMDVDVIKAKLDGATSDQLSATKTALGL